MLLAVFASVSSANLQVANSAQSVGCFVCFVVVKMVMVTVVVVTVDIGDDDAGV